MLWEVGKDGNDKVNVGFEIRCNQTILRCENVYGRNQYSRIRGMPSSEKKK